MSHLRTTHTYAELPVSAAAYDDVRGRIVALGREYVEQYIHEFGKPEECIVLGSVGLIREVDAIGSAREPDVRDVTEHRPSSVHGKVGFDYVAFYGGGVGPDVWDKEMEIGGVDIVDAANQAMGRAEESGGWVFRVDQRDYPEPTRDKLQSALEDARATIAQLREQSDDDTKAINRLRQQVERLKQAFEASKGL